VSAPLVSVVTIFRDEERFLEEAVASVLAQTYRRWELVLVDDGSTDRSTDLAVAFAERHPGRVRYVDHPGHANLGMSASRNRGIAESGGDLLAFLDADDVYLPRKLEAQVAALDAHPSAAMAYGPTVHWYSWTGRPEDDRDVPRRLGVPPDTLVAPPALVPLFLRLEAQTPGTCGLLVRREACDRAGGFEDRFRGMFEDQVFVCKVCLAEPVFVMGDGFDRYRQHPRSHSRMARSGPWAFDRPNPSTAAFLDWLAGHVAATGVDDPEVLAALDEVRWPHRHPVRAAGRDVVRRAMALARRP
jgi:glycosyltransferase involved in cell wall biosynthesis